MKASAVLPANPPSQRYRIAVLLLTPVACLIVAYVGFRTVASRAPNSLRNDAGDKASTLHEPAVQVSAAGNPVTKPRAETTFRSTREIRRRMSWYAGFIADYRAQEKDVQKLTAALINRLNELSDLAAAARAQGFDERRGNLGLAFAQFKGDASARFDAELRSAIGDEDLAELQRYDEKLPERVVVAELGSRLNALGDHLDSAVEKRVVEALWVARESDGERKLVGHPAIRGSEMPPFTERVVAASVFDRLSGILSDQELAVLHQIHDEQQHLGHFDDHD